MTEPLFDEPTAEEPPPVDAAVPDAPPKAPPPPPVVYSCKGRWSGSELRLAITGGRNCGSITFLGGAECSGALSGCSDGRSFSASYSCRYRDIDAGYSGTISMACTRFSALLSAKRSSRSRSSTVSV